MKIKNFKIPHRNNKEQPLTVDTLRKNISKSYIGRLKIRVLSIISRFKRFYRAYKMPTIATAVFLLVILTLSVVRQLERTSLLALINDVTAGGQRYSSLLSTNQLDEFIRNDTTEENTGPTDSVNQSVSESAQSNSTSFSLDSGGNTNPITVVSSNTGNQSSGNTNDTTGGGNEPPVVAPTLPFESSIVSFNRSTTTLQCDNPSKRNKGTCSKVYSFNSDIKTSNGPGTVSYAWQSNIASGNGNGNFSVGEGSAITAVSKQVTLGCNKDSSFTLQLAVLSPNTSSSNTITVNHNCNEL